MNYEYHSVFLASPRQEPKKYMGSNEYLIDGVQLTRDIQNTIHGMSEKGFDLYRTLPITSTQYYQVTYTEGVTLIFRKAL